MILSENQIKEILLKNPNQALLTDAQKYSKKMRTHLYGENLEAELPVIDGFEEKGLRTLRVKYAKSNKDILARLKRPVDKVFSARGGSVYYNLPDTADKRARQLSSDVTKGYSIKQWLENYWKPHYLDDPSGVIFMEVMPSEQVALMKQRGKSFVYPTYRSCEDIFDYLPNGSSLEYIVFKVTKAEKKQNNIDESVIVFRVVDDSFDYFVKVEGDQVSILKEHTFPNFFMKVPAILNSDIIDPTTPLKRLSLFDEVVELANAYLLKGSIRLTHDFLHGFPKYWQYSDSCETCHGNAFVEGEPCKTCKGTGKSIMNKVSDAMLLTHPQAKDDPVIAPNVAGYVSPSKDYWEMSNGDLQMLESMMHFTVWGADPMPKTQGLSTDKTGDSKTATEIVSELKPQADRLHPITESAEKRHKFILDCLVQIQISQNYQGATVNYGKRYLLEGPDVIWQKYSDARTKGAAASVLDDLLLEYYEAKYDSDPVKLAIQTKLMKTEPFVHMTALQVKGLTPDENDYKAKLYFSEWLQTVGESEILLTDVAKLKEQLAAYVSTKQLPQPEPKALPV